METRKEIAIRREMEIIKEVVHSIREDEDDILVSLGQKEGRTIFLPASVKGKVHQGDELEITYTRTLDVFSVFKGNNRLK